MLVMIPIDRNIKKPIDERAKPLGEKKIRASSVGIITAPSLQDPRQALALSLGTISLPCRDFIPPDFCSQASSNIKYHSCM